MGGQEIDVPWSGTEAGNKGSQCAGETNSGSCQRCLGIVRVKECFGHENNYDNEDKTGPHSHTIMQEVVL